MIYLSEKFEGMSFCNVIVVSLENSFYQAHAFEMANLFTLTVRVVCIIGVGRFRILGGPRFRILGGGGGVGRFRILGGQGLEFGGGVGGKGANFPAGT